MKTGLVFVISLIVLTSICDTINQLFLKSAINSLEEFRPHSIKKVIQFIIQLVSNPKVWGGFFFSTLSLLVWLFVLSKVDLNFAFSLDSMHYIFIALASKLILKERVGFKRGLGTLFIILGIILVSLS